MTSPPGYGSYDIVNLKMLNYIVALKVWALFCPINEYNYIVKMAVVDVLTSAEAQTPSGPHVLVMSGF